MNGTNFIDGLNGLVILYFLIIILILNLSGINFELNKNNFFIDNILPILIILLILNIFNKIYLGDSGSYLIGFLFSYYLISIYEQNQLFHLFLSYCFYGILVSKTYFPFLENKNLKSLRLNLIRNIFISYYISFLQKNSKIKIKF